MENFDLKKFLTESKLLKEEITPDVEDYLINLYDFDQVQINSNNFVCFDDVSPYLHVCNFNLIAIKYVIDQYFIDIFRTFT